jgi:hypothetical protein
MVSQCRVCGTKTRGQRQLCPDCRNANGGSSRNLKFDTPALSESINRHLSKGYTLNSINQSLLKRGYSKDEIQRASEYIEEQYSFEVQDKKNKNKAKIIFIIAVIIMIGLIIGYSYYQNIPEQQTAPNSSQGIISPPEQTPVQEQPVLSIEEQLKVSCISAFTSSGLNNLRNTEILESKDDVTSWLNANYIGTGLTAEQRQTNINNFFIIKKYDNMEYPVVIVNGDKKIDASMTEQGVYICNSNGLI